MMVLVDILKCKDSNPLFKAKADEIKAALETGRGCTVIIDKKVCLLSAVNSGHRASPRYEEGAWNFVNTVKRNLGNLDLILCPCIDCRNNDRFDGNTIVDHLVMRGMDAKYKQRKDWYEHGEHKISGDKNEEVVNDEIYNLFRAAQFFDHEHMEPSHPVNEEHVEPTEEIHDDDFIALLQDAETPLYPNCSSYSKLSAIVELFRLKTDSGICYSMAC
ncbi:hypothetical protein ACLB2K_003851 [Fragaria x ananassa]